MIKGVRHSTKANSQMESLIMDHKTVTKGEKRSLKITEKCDNSNIKIRILKMGHQNAKGMQDFQSNHNKATVVIGDSMIKQIDCTRSVRLANGQYSRGMRIRKETYRGAKVDAMKHHVKPCLTSKPDRIILHVGTNDIGSTKDEKEIIKGIGDICDKTGQPKHENCFINVGAQSRQTGL